MKTHTAAAAIADGLNVIQLTEKFISDRAFVDRADSKLLIHMICTQNNAILSLLVNLTVLIEDFTSDEDRTTRILSRLDMINSSLSEISKRL